MFERLKKHWYKSRTIMHNLISAALGFIPILLMTNWTVVGLSPKYAAIFILVLKLVDNASNIGWRAVTTKPLDKR